MISKLSVTFSADQKAVDGIVEGVMWFVNRMQCFGKEHAIEVALNEALANAVVHGAGSDPSKTIECDVVRDNERGLLIVVRDPGQGFDPASVPSPIVGENVYSHHGRGIYLINQLMDEVKFLKNGTEIHMLKK